MTQNMELADLLRTARYNERIRENHNASLTRPANYKAPEPPYLIEELDLFYKDDPIIVGDAPEGYCATLDGYDGAPDATGIYSVAGTGLTAAEAVQNLKDILDEMPCGCGYEEGRSEADRRLHLEECVK